MQDEVDIIWNITRLCPWDCAICCVDAHRPTVSEGEVRIQSNQLDLRVPRDGRDVYRQALDVLQEKGLELDLESKLRVIDNCAGIPVRLDFSGGDPLYTPETLDVLSYAADKIGRTNITLTATGSGFSRGDPGLVSKFIGELNFTYDSPRKEYDDSRPQSYSDSNLLFAERYAKLGVRTRAECPLTTMNCDTESLYGIYRDLSLANIDTLLVMRLFPVGRGVGAERMMPSPLQYRNAVSQLREFEGDMGGPKVKLQCALRFFDDPSGYAENPCDLVRKSFGLMPDGRLLASAWAYGRTGESLDAEWVVGDLSRQSLREILLGEKVANFIRRNDENFGHCKIFSWLNSKKDGQLDRIFDKSDPLLSQSDE